MGKKGALDLLVQSERTDFRITNVSTDQAFLVRREFWNRFAGQGCPQKESDP